MAEHPDLPSVPLATVVPKRRMRISVVWTIPILAAAVAIGIAVQRILNEGPTITIVFQAAEGLEAGKTRIKYKDVNIGQVTAVQLSLDYSKVEVTASIAKSAAGLIVEDARFWVVEPRVTLSGISGLGTLLSGNYIGFEAGKSTKKKYQFTGVETPPIITRGQAGRQFVLKADDLGSLGIGSPVYYRRLEAGQVIAYELAGDGKTVEIKVFISAPFDPYVNPDTRFWDASGFDVSVGADGLEVRTQSVVSLLAGGVAFDTPTFAADGEPAAENTRFTLYRDQVTAMKQPEAMAAHYLLYFTDSLRGLSVGAPVTILGLMAGEVTEIGLDLDPATSTIRGCVEIVSYPERLIARLSERQAAAGQAFSLSLQERRAVIQNMVEQRGLRAQLQSGSLITGQLYVAFDFFPDVPAAKIDWSKDTPELPVVPSTIPDLEAKLSGILAKVDHLPFEAIGTDVTKTLATLNETLQGANRAIDRLEVDLTPELRGTLDELRRVIATADQVFRNMDATLVGKGAPVQQELGNALQEIARAARSLGVLTDFLERHPEALIRGKGDE